MKKALLTIIPTILLSGEFYYYNNGKKVSLEPIYNEMSQRGDGTIFFTNEYGMKVGINNNLLVKLSPSTLIIDIEQKYNITYVKNITDTILMFKANSYEESIKVSNHLVENNEAKFAHPDFIREIQRR